MTNNKLHTDVYAIDALMTQTRQLAANYYQATQKTLPVSLELAKHDACRLLGLELLENASGGVDAVDSEGVKIQIKARVIFQPGRNHYRIGQLNLDGEWDKVVVVLMQADYQPFEIYAADRTLLTEVLEEESSSSGRTKRGPMSVSKFKRIGDLVWEQA